VWAAGWRGLTNGKAPKQATSAACLQNDRRTQSVLKQPFRAPAADQKRTEK
jgi:hypothetical protein